MIYGPSLGVVHTGRMAPVPVQTGLQGHIEPDQDNASGAELERQIQGLKAPVAAPSDDARYVEYQFVAPSPAFHLVDVSKPFGRVPILGQLQSFEAGAPFVDPPPLAVAGVEGFAPRTDLIAGVDAEGFAVLFPRGLKAD